MRRSTAEVRFTRLPRLLYCCKSDKSDLQCVAEWCAAPGTRNSSHPPGADDRAHQQQDRQPMTAVDGDQFGAAHAEGVVDYQGCASRRYQTPPNAKPMAPATSTAQ